MRTLIDTGSVNTDRKHPSVDIVIPVYRPDQKLQRILEMIGKQSVPPGKLILMVTQDREGFDLKEFLPKEAEDLQKRTAIECHLLSKSEFDHGLTRNRGVACSEAEIVVLMTDDAVPGDSYLIEQLLCGLSEEKTAICYARQLPGDDAGLAERFSREYNYPAKSRRKTAEDLETLGIKAFFCSNVCAAYKRRIFDELGGFTKTGFNEDMIFARKALNAGYAIQYRAEARVIHSHNFTNVQQFRRNYDLAVSQKLHPEAFSDVSSEKEGLRYAGKAFSYFRENGKPGKIIPFAVTCGFRFLGYKMGKIFG